MQDRPSSFAALSSPELLDALDRLAAQGRELTADLVALLAECDERKLYAVEGYASLFEFCVQRLRLSESQAYHRIQAARAGRRFPLVLERLRAGRVTLTAVALLREHLTEATHAEVLDWAEGRRKREVEEFVRALAPRPDVPTSLRRLAPPRAAIARGVAAERAAVARPGEASPLRREVREIGVPPGTAVLAASEPVVLSASPLRTEARETGVAASEPIVSLLTGPGIVPAAVVLPDVQAPPAVPITPAAAQCPARAPLGAGDRRVEIRPLAPARYSLHLTISQETHDKLRRAQDLLRHAGPAEAAVVLDRALTLLVAQLERQKVGAARKRRREAASSRRAAAQASVDPTAVRAKDVHSIASTGDQPPTPAAVGPKHARGKDVPLPVATNASDRPPTPAAVDQTPGRGEGTAPGATTRGSKSAAARSRYIPAAVRRAVWDRDGGRCAYVSRSGVRCGATARLEFHHRVPFAEGGASTVENVAVACRLHNQVEEARWFNCDQAEFATPPSTAGSPVGTQE